jgi:hypothetical protein
VKSWRAQVLTAETPRETLRLLSAAFEVLEKPMSGAHALRVAA